VPLENGLVVELLDSDTDGNVDALDADGDGQKDDLDADGFFNDEVEGLDDPVRYAPGSTFWRAELTHFSPLDFNLPWGPPLDAEFSNASGGGISDGQKADGTDPQRHICSFVEEKSRVFHEDIAIPGTDLTLHYASSRVAGYKPGVISVPASGETIPQSLERIVVQVNVAGRQFDVELDADTNQLAEIEWDGLDHLGRAVTGTVMAHIRVGYVYQAVYYSADVFFGQAFGQPGVRPLTIPARQEMTLWRDRWIAVNRGKGVLAEGWTLSAHHQFSPVDPSILYLGDGTISRNNARIIETIAGDGSYGYSGDGGPASEAKLNFPAFLTINSAGELFIADVSNYRIRKIDVNGIIDTIAGNGTYGTSGDGGPAIDAQIRPFGLDLDTSGNVYVADRDHNRVRKVDTDGIITNFAGNGSQGFSGDGGRATDAKLNRPVGLAADVNGNVYIADTFNHRVRKVDPNGIITTIAGTGVRGFSGDGGSAIDAQFQYTNDVAVDTDGNLYIADYLNCRIRKVDISGIITTVAGNGTCGISGDGDSALDARLNYPETVKVDIEGNLFIQGNSSRVRKVDTSGIIVTVAGNGMGGYSGDGGPATEAELSARDVAIAANGDFYIADHGNNAVRKVSLASASIAGVTTADETAFTELSGIGYIMSAEGFHQRTIELDTGLTLNEFGYDEDNNLLFVTDQFGNQITIEWLNGVPTAIISPDGITTELTVDPVTNHLTHITYPDGSFYEFKYTPDGLLELKTQPKGNQFGHVFDSNGRITDFTDDEGGHWQFFRTPQPNGDVLHETLTGEGDRTTYLESSFSTGAQESITTSPWGSETVVDVFERAADGLRENLSLSCGMELEFTYDVDAEYTYKYVTEMIERTPFKGLERITQMSKTYTDEDEDGIPDLVSERTEVNGKMAEMLHDIPNSQMIMTSPEGRTRTIFYDPDTLLPNLEQISEFHDTLFEYDIRGRIKTITAGVRQTVFDYVDDASGLQITVTDPDGLQSVYTFDTLDRLGLIERPDGSALGFGYDDNGNMELLVNPAGIEHDFEYTEVNLKEFYHTPLSGFYRYVYDKDRRLQEVHFPSGGLIKNVYEYGRLALIDLPDSETDVDLSYHPCGNNLESISQGIESISFGYDGSLLTSQDPFGTLTLEQSLAYTYNNDFRMETFEYALQKESYAYDNDGLLTAVGRFSIGRNPGNGLPETVTGADFSLVRDFNGFGELDSEIITVKGQAVASWTVTARYGDGKIDTKTETVAGEASTYGYTYDKAGRIQTVRKNGALVEEYTYDPDGTGTRVFEMNTQRGFVPGRNLTYSDEDHLETAGDTGYKYDPDGFLTTKTRYKEIDVIEEITDYEYSSRGELISVNMQPEGEVAKIVEYVHDPYGRRIAKIVDGSLKEKYLWQGMTRLLAVYDGNDMLLMRFEYADGRMPYAVEKGGEAYYLAYDQVGSLRVVADAAGNVKKRIDYDSFGNVILDTAPTFTVPFGFGGGLQDQDTGLVRFGFRDYDPDVGRWTAKDPIFFKGGDADLYSYVLNDPINRVDPPGLYVKHLFEDKLPSWLRDKRTPEEREAAQQAYYKDLRKRFGQAGGYGAHIHSNMEKAILQPFYKGIVEIFAPDEYNSQVPWFPPFSPAPYPLPEKQPSCSQERFGNESWYFD
jgi:RHS repeat-associated protein